MEHPPADPSRLVILGVAASDAHAVANQLIAMYLRNRGFSVLNLGVCTPLSDFADAHTAHPDAEAVIIGSLNGHLYQDLADLPWLRQSGRLRCPVIVGGNLSVGPVKAEEIYERLWRLGVDWIVEDFEELPRVLDKIHAAAMKNPVHA